MGTTRNSVIHRTAGPIRRYAPPDFDELEGAVSIAEADSSVVVMRAISTKGDAVGGVPRQAIALPGRVGIGGAIAQVMLDLDHFSVGRLEEMHDRGAEIFACDIGRWKPRFSA